ncbi:AraC family transcriptional regulator [Kocuria dechangensis]|uniref:AraC family transcriptional regulator n=1 Tax=Kocuria dechangensis TaxID=1176249 RepID=A0A917GHU2_9MICC|nr:helix-turn-helix domain-containing protein [Kocuria dechangensis]GGG46866.1 AraC family transcriptional regulator [Kocuria dechangensis]
MAPTPTGREDHSAGPVLVESIQDWSRLASRSFVPLQCTTAAARTFRAGLESREAGSLHVTHLRFGPHVVERVPGAPEDAGGGRFKVNLQLEGRCVVEQAGRRSVLGPGDVTLYDTSSPYRLDFAEDSRLLVLMFDHGVLDLPPAAVGQLRACRIGPEGPVHAMVASFLASMADHMAGLTGMNGQRLGNSALDLLTTSFNLELDEQVAASAYEKDRLRAAVHDWVEAHLSQPDLDPPTIARAHYISVRRLHQVFQEEGTTVSAWIRTRRLERCRRALEDPMSAGVPVARIAARWGFTDGAHFSRVFKAAYGISPSQARARALALRGPGAAPAQERSA